MVFWILLLILTAALVLGAMLYLVTRVRRFSCMRRLAAQHKGLSWLVAVGAVSSLLLFAFVNPFSAVIVVLHLALCWMVCDLVAWLVRRIRKKEAKRYVAGAVALALTALYLGGGWIAAHRVRQTEYVVTTQKKVEPLRVVLIADSHLGATLDGEGFAKQMERIQAAGPDLVVVAGDFVDDDSKEGDMLAACAALGRLNTTYGVYLVFGNHDRGYYRHREFGLEQLRRTLAENGVTVLEDEAVLLGGSFALIGRRDRSVGDRLSADELLSAVPTERYSILLDHQPNDYDAEAAAGVDLVLSGHTHGGHIFPAGPIGLWMGANDAVYGLSHRGGTSFLVTSGISGWAIPFKTGTCSEFVVIDIEEQE